MKEIKLWTRCLFNHISGKEDEYFWKDMLVIVVKVGGNGTDYAYEVVRLGNDVDSSPFYSYASELTPIRSCVMR